MTLGKVMLPGGGAGQAPAGESSLFLFFSFFFFFPFLAALQHMEFLGQGSISTHRLHLSCSNTRSLTHWAWQGIKTAADPVAPQRELPILFLNETVGKRPGQPPTCVPHEGLIRVTIPAGIQKLTSSRAPNSLLPDCPS